MGTDKATIEIGGVSQLQRAVSTLRSAGASEVMVSVASDPVPRWSSGLATADLRIVVDEGRGPLGGIVSALRETHDPYLAVLAVDLPGVRSRTVTELVRRCVSSGMAAVAAFDGAELRQPLLSVWSKQVIGDDLFRDWNTGERSVMRWLSGRADVAWCEVPSLELANVNEPADIDGLGNLEEP